MAVTANLLVRREAWKAVGGFAEHPRSGADADFCWRLGDAGWALEYRERAHALHAHRETVGDLLRQARRDGSAAPWLARRHRGYPARLGFGMFVRAAAGAIGWPLLGQPRRGLFKALDGVWGAAFNLGSVVDDVSPEPRAEAPKAVVHVGGVPRRRRPCCGALADAQSGGADLLIEALRRPARAEWRRSRRSAGAALGGPERD